MIDKDFEKDLKKIAEHYGVSDEPLSKLKSVTFKPYYFKSKNIKASKEVKALFWPIIK